jgi:hypothetical protein
LGSPGVKPDGEDIILMAQDNATGWAVALFEMAQAIAYPAPQSVQVMFAFTVLNQVCLVPQYAANQPSFMHKTVAGLNMDIWPESSVHRRCSYRLWQLRYGHSHLKAVTDTQDRVLVQEPTPEKVFSIDLTIST